MSVFSFLKNLGSLSTVVGEMCIRDRLSSGIRELLMSPDATQAAVACVVAGDGTYYWTLNYQ